VRSIGRARRLEALTDRARRLALCVRAKATATAVPVNTGPERGGKSFLLTQGAKEIDGEGVSLVLHLLKGREHSGEIRSTFLRRVKRK